MVCFFQLWILRQNATQHNPIQHNGIVTKHHYVTTPSQNNIRTSQRNPHTQKKTSCHNTITTKGHHHNTTPYLPKQHKLFCNTTPSQHNATTTQRHHNKRSILNTFFFSFPLDNTPPSILHHMTWLLQSRLDFGHHCRVSWPRAFGPSPITILTHHSFACRWRLRLPTANKSLL